MTRRVQDLYSYLAGVAAQSGYRFVMTSGDRRLCLGDVNTSYHLTGLAFDAQVLPYNARAQSALGSLAEQLGFRWGGRFAKRDVVHFDDARHGRPGHCPTR